MAIHDLLDEASLEQGRACSVLVDGRPLLVIRFGDMLHVLDDACPQDGHPLSSGEVSGGTIRCEKHGGRYELATGHSMRSGEDVRRYSARIEEGRVLVSLDTPLAEVEQGRIVASLRTALIQSDTARIARESIRLVEAGAEPLDLLRAAVRYGAERGDGGFHSALAACADFARIAPLYAGLEQVLPLSQALSAVAVANRSRPQRAIPERAHGVLIGTAQSRKKRFVQLVEERRAEDAEAMLAGALWQGMAISEAQQWLLGASCAHIIDGGATLVHATKALDLCDLLGMREAIHVLPPLVPPLVYGIREERTGPLREVAALLDAEGRNLAALLGRTEQARTRTFDDWPLRTSILSASAISAFDAIVAALEGGIAPVRVALAIVMAAAERALAFDELLEWDDASEATWEAALRPFLYAVATMRALERWTSPDTLRALFLAAASVQGARSLEADPRRRAKVSTLPASPREAEAMGAVTAALRTLRGSEAMSLARGYVDRGHEVWKLFEGLARYTVEDNLVAQGQVEQASALVVAGVDAWEVAGEHPDAALPLLLAVRYLSSDSRQRFGRRQVMQAIARAQKKSPAP